MDLDVLAARSAGLSGAEVAHVCREAGMQARDGWGGGAKGVGWTDSRASGRAAAGSRAVMPRRLAGPGPASLH